LGGKRETRRGGEENRQLKGRYGLVKELSGTKK